MPLFAFQQEDVDKLKSKRSRLVGSDPGTGKTYVGIALDQANRSGDGNSKVNADEYKVKKTLIVAPKSVLGVWDKHTMELTEEDVYLYDYHTRAEFMRDVMKKGTSGYFIVNWDSLRIKDLQRLKNVEWFHIIADEVHRAKNRKSQMTLALKKLRAVYKTGMSGTPADNRPQDFWSILNWLWPNYYTSFWRFVNAYCLWTTVDERTGEELGYKKFKGINMETIGRLHKEMEPWFVRRKKEDVLEDLPDKYQTRIWVDLLPKQRAAYDQMRKTMVAWAENYQEEIERQDPIIAQAVVTQLVRLQQYTCGYVVPQLHEDGSYVYRRKHKGHKRGECPYGDDIPLGQLDTETCKDKQQFELQEPSAKLDALMELLEDRSEEQFIVFSRFKSVIKLLEKRLEAKHIPYGLLTGDVKQLDRDRNVEDFQNGKTRVFTGTIQAGGVGITLTASSTVVFIDRTWSPSINLQAEDRAHRIGQTEAVEIIDIMAKNSVDMGMAQQLATKWKWLQVLLGDEVTTDELIKQMELEDKEMMEEIDSGNEDD